jgi:signal-transduction protein with cAMP-binding, CBS, and nucleotidyltransferase domain
MLKVKDRMARSLKTLAPEAMASDVAKIFADSKIGSIFIKRDGDVVGVITENDLVRKVMAKGKSPDGVTAESIMSTSLVTIDLGKPLTEAGDLMDHKSVRHLAVTEGGKIVGVISVRDLIHPVYTDGEGW